MFQWMYLNTSIEWFSMLHNGWIHLIVFDMSVMPWNLKKIRWNHGVLWLKKMSSSYPRAPARPLQKRHRRFALHGNPTWPRGRHLKMSWLANEEPPKKRGKIESKKIIVFFKHLTLLFASFNVFQSSGIHQGQGFPWLGLWKPPASPRVHQTTSFRNVAGRFLVVFFVARLSLEAWNSQSTGCAWSEPLKPQCILRRSQVCTTAKRKSKFETKSFQIIWQSWVMSES